MNASLDKLIRWIEENRWTDARIGEHVGKLGTTTTVGPGGSSTRIHVRDAKRKRNQYRTVNEVNIDRLEIKVGARYRPAPEVLG